MLAPERWARIRTLLEDVEGWCGPATTARRVARTAYGPPIVETTTAAPDLAPGTRPGVFEIVAPLGVGGMGRAYRARDTRLGRTVAIKVPGQVALSRALRHA